MSARFGPAGSSESFSAMGYRSMMQMPEYLVKMGLNAFEYQCGRGVNITEDKARTLGARARAANVRLSLHAPYYISLASAEAEKRDNSINYILASARAADQMGADRIVVHSGSRGKLERSEAMELALVTFKRALEALDSEGLGHIHICPETMGKINQLGDLDEVLRFCRLDERVIPCIDFGHLNARTRGGLRTRADFEAVFESMENAIGIDRMRLYHAHFSKIEYSSGGEVRHLTFEDEMFGPSFEPLLEITARKNCSPTIICESAGTQAEDAAQMKKYYEALLQEGVK